MEKSLKKHIISKCQELLNERHYQIQKSIAAIEESLTSETKSSAGDKHETGRAMLQLEREKAGNRLKEIEAMFQAFSIIKLQSTSEVGQKKIRTGSLVETENGFYFISVSLGVITIDKKTVYCISPQSPIGNLLLGKELGNTITFRATSAKILSIL
ncbi:GreA/GreB family elongation factor [Galbibacter sp. BG1]|uniref:GreA/GreB family elongation factor n=1 Tax=Galbibacter sp. BG1 TaxID=1170699 RepID=UPI0015BDEECB|nr:GreA/GreB family elongation factor [Galbibacter sp. BG1]QLE00995.1 GreA/GreB family elongation factor [Galbibacter sp. BG1]